MGLIIFFGVLVVALGVATIAAAFSGDEVGSPSTIHDISLAQLQKAAAVVHAQSQISYQAILASAAGSVAGGVCGTGGAGGFGAGVSGQFYPGMILPMGREVNIGYVLRVTKENSAWFGCLVTVDEISPELKCHANVPGGGRIPYTVKDNDFEVVG